MSMNVFFRAFSQQELDAMVKDPGLIEKWTWEDEKYSAETDVETAWDILMAILEGAGFPDGKHIDDTLSNGCTLISADDVRDNAQQLARFTHGEILGRLRNLGEDADLYHLECYQEEEGDLLEQFDKLLAFYTEAAEKGLAALYYAA